MHYTPATVAVGLAIARAPGAEHWSYALAKTVDLPCPTVSTVLRRMLAAGWLTVRVEPRANTPARRRYRLTDAGLAGLENLRQAAKKPPPTAGPPRHRARPRRPSPPRPIGTCPACLTPHPLREDGWLPGHRRSGRPCAGSWEEPLARDG
jgi:DNA-binding MarR family transcriptional regulator